VEEYDPATDTWQAKKNMPTPRGGFASAVVNDKIYVIGGTPANSKVEEYDPKTDKWTQKADLPTPRAQLSASVVNGKVYAIGGGLVGFVSEWAPKGLDTVEEYDPATDKWTKKADMPTGRSWLTTVTVSGKIFAIGGYAGSPPQNERTYLSTVEVYDPATNRWTKGSDMPTPRCLLSASVVDGKIYAIGGFTWPPAGWLYHTTVEEYDTGLPESVKAKGKLVTSWGKIKSTYGR
jgi:N-acetylneuraminic acid mutarotase